MAKFLTEKILIKVFLIIAENLAKRSNNDVDDQLVAVLKGMLE